MPLAWLGLGFSLGLFWGASAELPPLGLALLLLAVGGGYLLARSASLPLGGVALLAVGLILGAWRIGPDVLDPTGTLIALHGERVDLTGTVEGVAEPVGSVVRFTLSVGQTRERPGQSVVFGTAIVWATDVPQVDDRSFPFLEHGDLVTVSGSLAAPTQIRTFDYQEHLAARGINSVLSGAIVTDVEPATDTGAMHQLHATRASLARSSERHVPEPQAALTNALILGLRGGLSPSLNEDFRGAGLSHLLAVSGMHVGILLAIALATSARLLGRHRKAYLLPPLLLLWLYVLMVGAPPSAVRAGLMGTVFLLALATGRAAVPINALGLAAFTMLAIHPPAIWDRSFQLSFAAMAGALLIGIPLAKRAYASDPSTAWYLRAARQWIAAPAALSAGAVLGSLPLVAFNFGQIPLLSVPATLVAMPFVPLLLVTGLAAALIGSIAAPLGAIAGLAPAVLGTIVVGIAKAFASLPGATLDVQIGADWVWAGYTAIAIAIAGVLRRRWLPSARSFASALWLGPRGWMQTALVITALALVVAAPWSAIASNNDDGLLHVQFLDVGQGDATLIVSPSGATVLVDGGRDPRQTILAIDAALPATSTQIDLAILTHPDADHANGLLELARRGRIRQIITPPVLDATALDWQTELALLDIPTLEAVADMKIDLDGGLTLDVLHPPSPPMRGTGSDENNNSVTTLIKWRGASVLITGDLHVEGERTVLSSADTVDADVLQVGHHGSRTSTAPDFLDAVSPAVAIISVGADNRFGHPADEVVERLQAEVGDWLLQTSTDGSIELVSDGDRWFLASPNP